MVLRPDEPRMDDEVRPAPGGRPSHYLPDPERLKAAVSEEGQWLETKVGTPQGAVISPLLAKHLPALSIRLMGGSLAQESGQGRCCCRPVRRRSCATSTEGPKGPAVRNCFTDEGGPLGTGLQEQVPNHLWRLWAKAMVVSADGKGLERTRSGDWQEEDCKGTTDDVSKA